MIYLFPLLKAGSPAVRVTTEANNAGGRHGTAAGRDSQGKRRWFEWAYESNSMA